MKDMHYLYGFSVSAIENQVVAVGAPPNTCGSMPLEEWVPLRHSAQL